MQDMGLRTVQVRFGHVLGEEGYLQDVHRIDKWGRAWWTGMGTGDQWFPWIHIQDACNLIIHAIENENVQGPVNGVAPEMVKQKQLANLLTRALPPRTWKFPMPNTAINWFYPGRAHFLTEGRKVRPQVAQETGFTYIFPTLTETMSSLKPTLVPIKWKNPANRYFDPADPMNPNPLGRL
jgi:NAD dependent epimerase/dehydratase family enzyme